MWRSIAFWLNSFVAIALYAGVVLSPKILRWELLDDQRVNGQHELLMLEREADHFARIVTALQRDPRFAAELSRRELDLSRDGEEVIPVDAELSLQADTRPLLSAPVPATVPRWRDRPAVVSLACSETSRLAALAIAAALLVISFTWLTPTQEPLCEPSVGG